MDLWESIWSKHLVEFKDEHVDYETVFFALKRASGYDLGKGMVFNTFLDEYKRMKKLLRFNDFTDNVYEVGCGAGANLWLFQNDGIEAEGCDYAPSLVSGGTKAGVKGLSVGKADNFPIEPQFDSVISGGMFGYLQSEETAIDVLDRMVTKAKKSVCIKRILNKDREEELIQKRRKNEPDYDEKYKELTKLYLTKAFFEEYARDNNLDIYIEDTYMEGYWNNGFTFDVYLYKIEN